MKTEYLLEYIDNGFRFWRNGNMFFDIKVKKTEKNYDNITKFLEFIELEYTDMVNAYDYDQEWDDE